MPISSLKSYMGHTLGACGALEAWMTIEMMRSDWFAPTLNLERVDPRCGSLDYITGSGRCLQTDTVMSNSGTFAGRAGGAAGATLSGSGGRSRSSGTGSS